MKITTRKTTAKGRPGPKPEKRMRIVESIRRGIANGQLRPGEMLPDRIWYTKRFGVTNGTVQEAFDQLAAEGFTVAVRHKGTLVANPPPFHGRYLLALCGTAKHPAPYAFDNAHREAARMLSVRRGIAFEVRTILDEGPDSEAFDAVLADLRTQRYAGAFLRALATNRGLDTIGNVDDVPITGFFRRVDRSQGSMVRPLLEDRDGADGIPDQLKMLLEECRRFRRQSALFVTHETESEIRESAFRELASQMGIRCPPFGYLVSGLGPVLLRQLARTLALLLAPSRPDLPDCIVLDDDNFLPPLEEALYGLYGEEAPRRFFVVSNANRPVLPQTRLHVRYHGVDALATLASFVDWADAVRSGDPHGCLPRMALF